MASGALEYDPRAAPIDSRVIAGSPAPQAYPGMAFKEFEKTPDLLADQPHSQQGFGALLTLQDLEQIALQSNPTLVQAKMAVRAAEGEYLQSGLRPNPRIGYTGEDVGIVGTAGQQGASVSQEFLTGGKRRLGQAVASHDLRTARYGWEVQRRRVLNDVRAGYYEVLLAQRTIDVNEQLNGVGEKGVEVAEQLKTAMQFSQADVLQARIEADIARVNLNEARNHHQAAWHRLAAMLGQPQMEAVPLAGDVTADLPQFTREESLRQLLDNSPELSRARSGVQRARCELARQCARRIPNFEVEVAAKYDYATRDTLADVALTLPLPIFDRNQGNIVKAEAELIAARREVQRIDFDLQDRFAAAYEQYGNSRERAEVYSRNIIPNAKEALRLTRIGADEGEFGYVALLTAQRTYFSASLAYLNNLEEFWDRSVQLEGMLLSGGLGPRE